MFVLKGHTLSVWAVLVVDVAQTLTASADKTIRLWEQSKQVKQYTGHTDAVRGLALVPDIGFASCSNDRFVDRAYFIPENSRGSQRDSRLDFRWRSSLHITWSYFLCILPCSSAVWRHRIGRRRPVGTGLEGRRVRPDHCAPRNLGLGCLCYAKWRYRHRM